MSSSSETEARAVRCSHASQFFGVQSALSFRSLIRDKGEVVVQAAAAALQVSLRGVWRRQRRVLLAQRVFTSRRI